CFTPEGELLWVRELDIPNASSLRTLGMEEINGELIVVGEYDDNGFRIFSASFNLQGDINWAREYQSTIGDMQLAATDAKNRLIVTNNGLLIPASLYPGDVPAGIVLLRTDAEGIIEDDCLNTVDVDLSSTPVQFSNPLFQLASTQRDEAFGDFSATLSEPNLPLLTSCLDDCPPFSAECPTTGPQFVQLLDFGEGTSSEAHQVILDQNNGLYVAGVVDDNIYIANLNITGQLQWSSIIPIPQGIGQTVVIHLSLASDGDILLAGSLNTSSTTERTGYMAKFNPLTQQVVWWRELEPGSEIYDLQELNGVSGSELMVIGARLQSASPGHAVLLQKVALATGQLIGALNQLYNLDDGADQVTASEVKGNQLITAGRYTYNGSLSGMRTSLSLWDLDGNEIISHTGHPNSNANARLYATSVALSDDGIYVLYRGDDSGIGTTDVSKVWVAHFSTQGNWIWGIEYDITNYTGEYGLELKVLDNILIIAGMGYNPDELFAMSVDRFEGVPNWAKGYQTNTGGILRSEIRGDYGLLATHGGNIISGHLEFPPGSSTVPSRSLLIRTDVLGNLSSDCFSSYDLDVSVSYLQEPWEEVSLEVLSSSITPNLVEKDVEMFAAEQLTACGEPCETTDEICDNGIDDNQDGFTDCEDPTLANTCCCLPVSALDLGPDTSYCTGNEFSWLIDLNNSSFTNFEWQDGSTLPRFNIDTTGIYWLIVTDSCGRTATDSVVVTAIDLNNSFDLGPDLLVCDNAVTLLNAGPGWYSYRWSDFSVNQSTTFYGGGVFWGEVTDSCGQVYRD
ncbi:MAG: hypothetical protein AAFU03_08835, partial [Bacteroidota bacterium]